MLTEDSLIHDMSGLSLQHDKGGAPPSGASSIEVEKVAGQSAALQALRELVGWPVRYASEGRALGVRWPKGLLLHGPPGCGKTLMVRSVAGMSAD